MKKFIYLLLFKLIPVITFAQEQNTVHFFDSTERKLYSISIRSMVNMIVDNEERKRQNESKIVVVYVRCPNTNKKQSNNHKNKSK